MTTQPSPEAERHRVDQLRPGDAPTSSRPTRDSELRTAWLSRSWQHKARHRWNVISAFVRQDINHHSMILGLLEPHAVQHLALNPRRGTRGILIVCPEAAREMYLMCAPGETKSPIA